MIILREYVPGDWYQIKDAVEPFMLPKSYGFNKTVQHGLTVTATEDDVVMACGGVTYINEKEGMVWVKVSRKCFRQPFRWGKIIRETFALMAESIGAMRIVAYILKDFCKGERLVRLIGMTKTKDTHEFNNNIYRKYMVVI
jgi:hypothetical protein